MITGLCPKCHEPLSVVDQRSVTFEQYQDPPHWIVCPHCRTTLRLIFDETYDEEKLQEHAFGWFEEVPAKKFG
jgi:uncharacterized protein YbaR (Trm112 family)